MLFTPSTSVARAWNSESVEPRQPTSSGSAMIEVGAAVSRVIVGPVLTQTLTVRASVPDAGARVAFEAGVRVLHDDVVAQRARPS